MTVDPVAAPSLFKWGIEQGALVVLLIVIIYFYRKDFQSNETKQKETIALLMEIVTKGQEFSTALLDKQSRLTEQSIAVHTQVAAALAEQTTSYKLLIHDFIKQGSFSSGHRKNPGDS